MNQAEKNRAAAAAAAAAANMQKSVAGPMRLYVGSLHFNITEEMLKGIFEPFGKVCLPSVCPFAFLVCFVQHSLHHIFSQSSVVHFLCPAVIGGRLNDWQKFTFT